MSWLFRTCFKLQASLDRRFLHFGMTFQEAAVLTRCVEDGETASSRLALTLGRDKGKMTRLVDRLEAAELVKRIVNPRDRRYSIINATPKGKRLAERIASTFEQIREELFVGVLEGDIQRLSGTLPQLHRNAVRIGSKRLVFSGPRKPRIGDKQVHSQKVEAARIEDRSPAMELSSTMTGRQNSSGGGQRSERLVPDRNQLAHALDTQAALQKHYFSDLLEDPVSPVSPLFWRRASTFCKAPLKKSTSRVFSASSRFSRRFSFR